MKKKRVKGAHTDMCVRVYAYIYKHEWVSVEEEGLHYQQKGEKRFVGLSGFLAPYK